MVGTETVKGVLAQQPAEGWYWKAISGLLAAALAAIAVQARSAAQAQAQVAAPAVSEAQVSRLEARLAQLEAAQVAHPASPEPQVVDVAPLATRLDKVESRLASIDEMEDWEEATRLGVAKVLAQRGQGFTPEQEAHLAATIIREARAAGLDPLLVAGVIQVESGFNNYAVSPVGAVGLMQLMPATAGWLSKDEVVPTSAGHLFDFERNVHLGCQYLAALIRQFGTVDRALVAYNMGPAAARKALAGPRAKTLLAGYPKAVEKARKKLVEAQSRGNERQIVAAVEKVTRQGR